MLFFLPAFAQKAKGDADKGSDEQTRIEGQTRDQERGQASRACGDSIGAFFERRNDERDKGQWEREIQRPARGDVRAEQQAGGSAYLPGEPENQARPQE